MIPWDYNLSFGAFSAMNATSTVNTPVSYTHLDVYKRQVLITSENFGRFSQEGRHVLEEAGLRIIDNPYGHTFLHREQILPIVGEADGIICDMEKIDREAVSYTHLWCGSWRRTARANRR